MTSPKNIQSRFISILVSDDDTSRWPLAGKTAFPKQTAVYHLYAMEAVGHTRAVLLLAVHGHGGRPMRASILFLRRRLARLVGIGPHHPVDDRFILGSVIDDRLKGVLGE